MARAPRNAPEGERRILPSVLDRLLDDEPDRTQEPVPSANQVRQALRDAIRRDVEAFFNARRRMLPVPEDYSELRGTVLDHGVPDFVGQNLGSRGRRRTFLQELEGYLRKHESRFKSLELVPLPDDDEGGRHMRFRIDAVVYAEPAPESLHFDSRLEPVSRSFSVRI